MSRYGAATIVVIVLGALCHAHGQPLTNGSFEAGDLSGWFTSGNAFARTDEQPRDFLPPQIPDWLPSDGAYFASLWSTNSGGIDHAELAQTFTAPAGYTLEFDYFFDYGDAPPFFDWALAELTLPDNTIARLFEHNTAGHELSASQNIGWMHVQTVLTQSGAYSLRFATQDAAGSFESILGVDAIVVVPEPASVFLLAVTAIVARRR